MLRTNPERGKGRPQGKGWKSHLEKQAEELEHWAADALIQPPPLHVVALLCLGGRRTHQTQAQQWGA